MKVTQKNIRAFHIEIDDEEAFLDYFRKNSLLLKEFFLLVEGTMTTKIAFVLEQSGVCYKNITGCGIRFGGLKKELPALPQTPLQTVQIHEMQEPKQTHKVVVFDRPIRSGEEVHESSPMVIFGRVNSGAKVFCEESMSVYGIIDGLVQCDGEYMVMNGISPRGHVIFNGEIVDRLHVKEATLQKIVMREGLLEIKELV